MTAILLSPNAGFLVIAGYVFAFRYSDTGDALVITNPEGAAVLQPLMGDDAKTAMQTILVTAEAATAEPAA
jgi:hypothetical protein